MISHLKYYYHFCYLLFQGKGASNSFLPGIKKWLCVSCSLVGSFLLKDVLPGVTGTLFIFLPFGMFFFSFTDHTCYQSDWYQSSFSWKCQEQLHACGNPWYHERPLIVFWHGYPASQGHFLDLGHAHICLDC